MKTLSVKNPFAYLICSGIKDIENRSRKTNFRGIVLIHASSQLHPAQFTNAQSHEVISKFPILDISKGDLKSAIIGLVEIVDCVQNHPSVWAEKGLWHWVLNNASLFDKPIINVKGKLNFWDYDIELAVSEQQQSEPVFGIEDFIKDKYPAMPLIFNRFSYREFKKMMEEYAKAYHENYKATK